MVVSVQATFIQRFRRRWHALQRRARHRLKVAALGGWQAEAVNSARIERARQLVARVVAARLLRHVLRGWRVVRNRVIHHLGRRRGR